MICIQTSSPKFQSLPLRLPSLPPGLKGRLRQPPKSNMAQGKGAGGKRVQISEAEDPDVARANLQKHENFGSEGRPDDLRALRFQ